jgi:hypothetical protein
MLVCIQVYFCPESPRWYMIRGRYSQALHALKQLRPSTLQAARDLYYIHAALKVEENLREGKNLWREMFTIPRNRRAAQSSFFVMFMQQVCSEEHQLTKGITDKFSSVVSTPSCTTRRPCSVTQASGCASPFSCPWGVVSQTGSSLSQPCIPSTPLDAGTSCSRPSP